MKALLLILAAMVAVASITVGAFVLGRASVDQTLYCGAFTHAYVTEDGERLNGCELLPGYKAVRS